MSRSRKIPIYKDNGFGNQLYRRTIRRVQKYFLRINKDIPNARQIINDYTRCDYSLNFRNTEYEVKSRRK